MAITTSSAPGPETVPPECRGAFREGHGPKTPMALFLCVRKVIDLTVETKKENEEAGLRTNPLEALRRRIDQVDRTMIDLIALRVEYARRIGRIKGNRGLPTTDRSREAEVMSNVLSSGPENLPRESLQKVFAQLIELCRRVQEDDYEQK
ncbi:hypothetical protein GF402_08160 [Candidatus Fermentibacteria bacterium]|nr:hypothetical protein [Candidatus Fermentibacteria bacterium]